MKIVRCGVVAAGLTVALCGCAATPESIKAANISPTQYAYLNCAQLVSYRVTLLNAYNKAADSENNARMEDAATSIVLGFPVGSMTHQSAPYQISDLKGRINAVDKLEAQNNCRAQSNVASN